MSQWEALRFKLIPTSTRATYTPDAYTEKSEILSFLFFSVCCDALTSRFERNLTLFKKDAPYSRMRVVHLFYLLVMCLVLHIMVNVS